MKETAEKTSTTPRDIEELEAECDNEVKRVINSAEIEVSQLTGSLMSLELGGVTGSLMSLELGGVTGSLMSLELTGVRSTSMPGRTLRAQRWVLLSHLPADHDYRDNRGWLLLPRSVLGDREHHRWLLIPRSALGEMVEPVTGPLQRECADGRSTHFIDETEINLLMILVRCLCCFVHRRREVVPRCRSAHRYQQQAAATSDNTEEKWAEKIAG